MGQGFLQNFAFPLQFDSSSIGCRPLRARAPLAALLRSLYAPSPSLPRRLTPPPRTPAGEGGSYKEMQESDADEQQFSPLGRAVMALELGVGAIKNGDGPGAALKAMMRYGSDDVIPPGVA